MRGSLSPTSANGTITLVRGQNAVYLLTVEDNDGNRQPLTGATIEFEVKQRSGAPDPALIHKDLTPATGGIVLLDQTVAGTKGQAMIYLVPADTTAVDPEDGNSRMLAAVLYVYDVWVTLGGVRTPVVRPRDVFLLDSVGLP